MTSGDRFAVAVIAITVLIIIVMGMTIEPRHATDCRNRVTIAAVSGVALTADIKQHCKVEVP